MGIWPSGRVALSSIPGNPPKKEAQHPLVGECVTRVQVCLTPFTKSLACNPPVTSSPQPDGPAVPSPALAPVGDLVLVPLGLPGEEVVVGHVGVATPRLPHGLDGALVQLARLGQPEELLHLLKGVLEHKQVAALLGAAVEGVQVLLEETRSQGRKPWEGRWHRPKQATVTRLQRQIRAVTHLLSDITAVESTAPLLVLGPHDSSSVEVITHQHIECSQ